MTEPAIISRNKSNAQKSTGPKTASGRAISSQNARRHGVTGKADPERLSKLLAVILDAPNVDLTHLYASDTKIAAARDLATAEVRLETAERALIEFEAGRGRLEDHPTGIAESIELVKDCFDFLGPDRLSAEEFLDKIEELERLAAKEMKFGGRRHRLLRRYLREAQTGRSSALKAWINVNKGEL